MAPATIRTFFGKRGCSIHSIGHTDELNNSVGVIEGVMVRGVVVFFVQWEMEEKKRNISRFLNNFGTTSSYLPCCEDPRGINHRRRRKDVSSFPALRSYLMRIGHTDEWEGEGKHGISEDRQGERH